METMEEKTKAYYNLMKALKISNTRIGELIEENYYLKEQLENQCEQKPMWKPNVKQIKALRWVLQNIPYNIHKEEINELLEQLQQL